MKLHGSFVRRADARPQHFLQQRSHARNDSFDACRICPLCFQHLKHIIQQDHRCFILVADRGCSLLNKNFYGCPYFGTVIVKKSRCCLLYTSKIAAYAPVVLCAGSGIAFLMFIRMMIWPISDTIYGIEPFQHMNEIYICAALLVLSFLFSEISLYMKKTKEAKPKAA